MGYLSSLRHRLGFMVVVMILTACGGGDSGAPSPTEELPAPPKAPTAAAATETLHEPTSTAEQVIEPPGVPDAPLSFLGPWWVFAGRYGVWVVNEDGSGLTQLLEPRESGSPYNSYRLAAAPRGGRIAVVSVEDLPIAESPKLSVISVPWGSREEIAVLFPEAVSGIATTPENIDIWVTVGVWNNVTWSNDGQVLAFNGAMDGASSDLYVYNLEDESLTRMTGGPTQSADVVWSPDDQTIINSSVLGTNYDRSGFGYIYDAVWSVHADGSQVARLFSTEAIGRENVLGWVSDTAYLADTSENRPVCFRHNMRIVDAQTAEITTIWSDYYAAGAFDPESQTVLISILDDQTCGDQRPGLYLISLGQDLSPLRIVEDEMEELAWSVEAKLFFGRSPLGVIAVDTNGNFIDLVVPDSNIGLPVVAPYTRTLAWTGDELWIGTLQDSLDQLPQPVFTGPVPQATWDPDGEDLLFTSEESLYVAYGPDYIPTRVVEGVEAFNAEWVFLTGPQWRTYTTDNGLPGNQGVFVLARSDGALWFCAQDGGVGLFDGEEFAYFSNDYYGAGGSGILSAAGGPDDSLWIGSDADGLFHFDGDQWSRSTMEDGLPANSIWEVAIGPRGGVWVGTEEGAAHFDGNQWTTYTTQDGLSSDDVQAIVVDNDGGIWFGTENGVSRLKDGGWRSFTTSDGLANNDVTSIAIADDNKVWFGTRGGGVTSFDGQRWVTYDEDDGLTDNIVSVIYPDSDGVLWFGTTEGISQFNGERIKPFEDGLTSSSIFSITQADDGAMWFGRWLSADRYFPLE